MTASFLSLLTPIMIFGGVVLSELTAVLDNHMVTPVDVHTAGAHLSFSGRVEIDPILPRVDSVRVPRETTDEQWIVRDQESASERIASVANIRPVPVLPPTHIPDSEYEQPPVNGSVTNDEAELVTPEIVEGILSPAPLVSTAENEIIAEVISLTNVERKRQGLGSLTSLSALTEIAESHSIDMAEYQYLSHTDSDDCGLTCRVKAADITPNAWAENVAYIEKSNLLSSQEIAREIVDGWLSSGVHRQNLLNANYTNIGVGIAYNQNTIYITVDYARF